MDKREKYGSIALLALVAVTAFLKMRGHSSVADTSGESEAANPFAAPYLTSTPGIADNPVILNGGAPFESTVNVTVNPSYLGSLSQNYIPMFGFVGMGYDGGGGGGPAPAPQLAAPPLPPAAFTSAPKASLTSAATANLIQTGRLAPQGNYTPNGYAQPSPFSSGGSKGYNRVAIMRA